MRKKYIVGLIILLSIASLITPVFAQKDFFRQFKVLRLAPEKIFTLTLEANPSTGFSWQLVKISDQTVLEFVKKEYLATASNLVGVPGKEVWTFKTLAAGQATINLEYRRVWEKDVPAAKTEEFSIFVK